ncbi:MAG: tetratricopeptide repeat protein [Planctomycetes bacterium]|nr:tetratricopeptide repeat protein [Planctomycetota bacterium]
MDYSQTRMLRRAPRWAAPLAVGLLAAAAYVNTLGNGFVCDDLVQVVQDSSLASLSNVPQFFLRPYWRDPAAKDRLYRPVTVTTLAIDRVIGGGTEPRAAQFHATNLFLHVCASLLVLGVAAAWNRLVHDRETALASVREAEEAAAMAAREKELREAGRPRRSTRPTPRALRSPGTNVADIKDEPPPEPGDAPGSTTTRFWPVSPTTRGLWAVPVVAAMLFAVHPAHTDAVDSVVQRSEILATCGVLVGLWAGWQADAQTGRRRMLLLVLAGVAYLVGLGSKETAVVLPILWLVHDAFAGASLRGAPDRRKKYLAAGIALLVYLAARFHALGLETSTRAAFGDVDLLTRAATMTAVFGDYLRLLILPHPLCADYAANANPGVFCRTFGDDRAAVGALVISAAGVLGAWSWRRRSPIGVWLPWVPIGLLPVSNLFPIGAIQAERFCYLPSVGACVALATLFVPIRAHGVWNGARRFAGVLAVCAGLALCRERNPVWGTPESFAEALVADAPDNPFGYYLRGFSRGERGDAEAALQDYSDAIRVSGDHPYLNALHRRALTYSRLGRYGEAVLDLEAVLAVQPGNWKVRNNLAMFEVLQGGEEHLERAIREYTHILTVDGQRQAPIWNNRARTYQRLKRFADASADLEEYLVLMPKDWSTWADRAACEASIGHEEEVQRIVRLLEESGHTPSDILRAEYEARLKAFREHGGGR